MILLLYSSCKAEKVPIKKGFALQVVEENNDSTRTMITINSFFIQSGSIQKLSLYARFYFESYREDEFVLLFIVKHVVVVVVR